MTVIIVANDYITRVIFSQSDLKKLGPDCILNLVLGDLGDNGGTIELPINARLLMYLRNYLDKGKLSLPKIKNTTSITPGQIEGYLGIKIFKPNKSETTVTYNWRTFGH